MRSGCLTLSICASGSRGSIRNLFCPGWRSLRTTRDCEWICAFKSLVSASSSSGQEEASPSRHGLARICARLRKVFTSKSRESAVQYQGLQHGYICWIDEPVDWRGVNRRFRLAGWCFSKNSEAIDGLRARLGDHEFIVSHGLTRPDVARTYPDQAGALQSGFEAMVEAPRGAVHNLHFEARQKGLWREVFSQRIVVSRKARGSYEDWIRSYDTLRWSDRSRIRKQIKAFRLKPRFSILLPLFRSTAGHLRDAIESVRAQFYPELATYSGPGRAALRKRRAALSPGWRNVIVESSCASEATRMESTAL